MPRIATEPLPELTVRGTVRKNRMYFPEEDIENAVQMVRNGVFVTRAARLCKVPVKRVQRRIDELKASKTEVIETYWGKNAPKYLAKLEAEEEQKDEEDDVDGTNGEAKKSSKKPKVKLKSYTHENLAAAVEGVKSGLYTVNAAHNVFNVNRKHLMKLLAGEELIPNPNERRGRHVFKLDFSEELIIVDYALTLHKLGVEVTFLELVPLAKQFVKQRNDTLKDERGWARGFVKRHKELQNICLSPSELMDISKQAHVDKLFARLTDLYDTYNLHMKPSRIFSCEAIVLDVERYDTKDPGRLVNVEMLVATNAVGYHIFPPCVVHDEEDGIPDFLGLMEAGFVSSKEKKITSSIMVS